MKLRELLPILDPDAVLVVYFDDNKGFRSTPRQVPNEERYAPYLERQVNILTNFFYKDEIGIGISLKGE